MAYAMGLDPKLNLSHSMPQTVLGAGQMSLRYYVGNTDVLYSVEWSTDLKIWSTKGVTFSTPDADHFLTASVPTSGLPCFMRLGFTH